jgi:hypothetical protein
VDTLQDRTERRFRLGGLFFVLVGALAALYALSLHLGSAEPPSYGLASAWILDNLARTADRVGGLLGQGWEERAYQVNLGVAAAFALGGLVAWLGSRMHRVFSFLGFVPRLLARLVYLVAFAAYATDSLLALGLELSMRRLYGLPSFAISCLVLHGLVLALLALGLSNGLYILVEIWSILTNPAKALRQTRADRQPAPPDAEQHQTV